jgi:hypothetical protein
LHIEDVNISQGQDLWMKTSLFVNMKITLAP